MQRRQRRAARRQGGLAGPVHGMPPGGCLPRVQQRFRQYRGNIGPGPDTAVEISFRQQLLIGRNDRIARYAKILRQRPRGRQPRARGQAAGQDGFPDCEIKLAVQWHPVIRIQRYCGQMRRAGPSW